MKRKKRQNRRQKQSRGTRPNRADFRRTVQANPAACKSGSARTTYNGKADGTHGSKARKKHRKHPRSRNKAVPKPKVKSAPAAETPAAEPQPEEDTGLVDRIKAAIRADPVGYVRHLFSVLRTSVGPLLRGFRVSKLNVIWTITGETAAETAILYGQTLTTLNTILAIAQDHIKIQADQLWLEADYTGSAKQQRVVSLKLLLCPLLALVTVVCFVWHARHDPQLLPPKHPKYNTPETEQGGNL